MEMLLEEKGDEMTITKQTKGDGKIDITQTLKIHTVWWQAYSGLSPECQLSELQVILSLTHQVR
jgi:hypothetical protein